MQIDLSLTITSIIALCAIISPIITTALNNHHQSVMKKIEFYELAKRESLTNFINNFTLYFHVLFYALSVFTLTFLHFSAILSLIPTIFLLKTPRTLCNLNIFCV